MITNKDSFFIDIHTHNLNSSTNLTVINLFESNQSKLNPNHFYSIGIHPWYIDEDSLKRFASIESFAQNNQIIAIGEAGLDLMKGPDLSKQLSIFDKQIKLADKLSKPLIIHCVKAYDEIIKLKKSYLHTVPWIFHGFQSSQQMAEQLLAHDIYLSFGKAITREGSNAQKALKIAPKEKIFLETDDSAISIEQIYVMAAKIRGESIEMLQEIIKSNFINCFRIEFK